MSGPSSESFIIISIFLVLLRLLFVVEMEHTWEYQAMKQPTLPPKKPLAEANTAAWESIHQP